MTILRLAAANLKKKKGLTATLILLSALAALFLNLGLIMSGRTDGIFPECAGRLKSPDLFVMAESSRYKTSFETFLRGDGRVEFVEKEEIIYLESSQNSANSSRSGVVIFNTDTPRRIEPLSLLEEDKTVEREEAIYLPKVMKGNGTALGEEFTLTLENAEHTFRVAGYFETSYMGTSGYAFMKFYLPGESFRRLYETTGTGKALSVRLKEGLPVKETASGLAGDFLRETDFYTEVGGTMVMACCLSYADLEDTVRSLFAVPMMIMIAMAFMICVINFMIVFFKVREEIDESMTNIGSLQAMGYTTGQIMEAKIAEFVLAGGIGAAAGILLTYAALPFAASNVEGMIGIVVLFAGHAGENAATALVIVLLLFISALSAAGRIRRITPVTALRRGVRTHHYGRNFFPLDQGCGTLYLRLALKNICTDIRQNLVTVLSIGLSVFSICIAVILYANIGYDHSTVEQMTGIEIADIQVKPLPEQDVPALERELASLEEVRKTNRTESYMARIGEDNLQLVVCEDFEKTEYLNVSEGTLPKYENEIVLTSSYLNRLGKRIGDLVCVTAKGVTAEYMIVGAGMGTNMNGRMGMMSEEGLHRLDPYYELTEIAVYLKEGVSRSEFMARLRSGFGDVSLRGETPGSGPADAGKYEAAGRLAEERIKRLLDRYGVSGVEYAVMLDGEIILSGGSAAYRVREISSLTDYLDGQLKSYAAMMTGMTAVILAVMILVMGTIVSVTVSSMLRRQRSELGTYRALGFTAGELVRIIRLHFTVDAVLGSLLGILLCGLSANRLLALFFETVSVNISRFEIKLFWLAGVAAVTVLYVSLLAGYKALRVRRITVYELLAE